MRSVVTLAITAVLPVFLAAAARAGDKVALVVGVERYRETELSSLEFADDDATELGGALERLGFDVVTMTSTAEKVSLRPDAPSDILESLDRRLRFRDKEDVVVVSLSGHGVQLVGDAPRPDGTRETWFCPAKARLGETTSLLAISEVVRRMAACPAARKLLLVDACRDDMRPPGANKARDVVEVELDPAAPARRLIPDGMVALFSCSAREKSFERKDLRHSLFSYYVIQYLSGDADDPGRFYDDGEATLTDLVAYAQKRTARSAEKLGADQTPELVGRMTNWSFGRVVGGPAVADPRPAPPRPSSAPPRVEVVQNSLGMRLVAIPAGEFQMGATATADEMPPHRVRITKPFLMGQTEVTQAQFQQVMGTTPWRGQQHVKEGGTCAATYVSWSDAVEFCRRLTGIERLTYRLPTEAEWEYACRAGTTTEWSCGDDELGDHAWWGGFAEAGNVGNERHAHEVGLKKPNRWNLHDMHGNVLEWCSDWLDGYDTAIGSDPTGPPTPPAAAALRVVRGGSWGVTAAECRSAHRDGDAATARNGVIGFRVVQVRE